VSAENPFSLLVRAARVSHLSLQSFSSLAAFVKLDIASNEMEETEKRQMLIQNRCGGQKKSGAGKCSRGVGVVVGTS
jgi:hypothetical protein